MSTARLPPNIGKQWSGLKNRLKPDISKMSMPSEQKSLFLKEVTKLYGEFDQGLSAKVKTASTSTNDTAAKAAIGDVMRISSSYLQKLDSYVNNPKNDMAKGGLIHTAFKKALDDIHEAATSTLAAMG
jgi:hypothetical protein